MAVLSAHGATIGALGTGFSIHDEAIYRGMFTDKTGAMTLIGKFKRSAKRNLQAVFPCRYPPIIVASMGRSGSTLVCDAVREGMAAARFGSLSGLGLRMVADEAWDLDTRTYTRGVVYKTHGFAHELPHNTEARVIFLFGAASDAALSVLACRDRYGAAWIDQHFAHLRANGPFRALGTRDVLRFEEQLDSWLGRCDAPRLVLHYDALWEHIDTLSKFVGFPVSLPPKRARSGANAADAETRQKFVEVYGGLDTRIEDMPRCQILD